MTSTAANQADAEALSRRIIRQLRTGLGPLLAALILICIGLSIASPEFLTTSTLTNIMVQVSVVGIAAVGGTFVIITSGIDLSVGSLVALSGMVAATVKRGVGGGCAGRRAEWFVGCVAQAGAVHRDAGDDGHGARTHARDL
jgi:ribose/xylose/arabinose/galactoside ABC-type transport system permease subunit